MTIEEELAAAQEMASDLVMENMALQKQVKTLLDAITHHHAQRSDDRCWMDDDDLYTAAGLPAVDTRVGDKFDMLKNCARFLDQRCSNGGWATYAELEKERDDLKEEVRKLRKHIEGA